MDYVPQSNKVVKIFHFNPKNSHADLQKGWNHKKGKSHLKLAFAGNFGVLCVLKYKLVESQRNPPVDNNRDGNPWHRWDKLGVSTCHRPLTPDAQRM